MGVRVPIGTLRQVGTLSTPTTTTDNDGGYTQTLTQLDPPVWRFSIEKATVRSAERHFAGTIIAQGQSILTGRFHPGMTTETKVVWVDRAEVTHTAHVLAVDDPEGAGVLTVVLVSEVVP